MQNDMTPVMMSAIYFSVFQPHPIQCAQSHHKVIYSVGNAFWTLAYIGHTIKTPNFLKLYSSVIFYVQLIQIF